MSEPGAAPAPAADGRGFFLPDFCEPPAVLAIVLIAALLGFVLALARQSSHGMFWFDLARTAAFLLWAGLLCAAVLCRSRSWLAGKSLRAGIAWSLLLMVGTVAVLSEAVYLLGRLWAARLGVPSAILPDSHWRFVLPNVLIAAVVGALALRYFYVSQQWRRSVELEARARIRALQARIRPHFLFNSLNAVLSLIRARPQQAEAALESLSDLFRAAMRDPGELVSLADEIALGKQYLELEKLRLGERLAVDWKIGTDFTNLPIPPLMLQPLLENAVYHGIEPSPEGGVVCVVIERRGEELRIAIANPACDQVQHAAGNQIAVANIRERLALYYDLEARLEIAAGKKTYEVRIILPCRMPNR